MTDRLRLRNAPTASAGFVLTLLAVVVLSVACSSTPKDQPAVTGSLPSTSGTGTAGTAPAGSTPGTAAPGTTIDRAAQPGGAAALEGTTWVLVPSSLGRDVPAGGTFAIVFQDGEVGGRLACNQMGGFYDRNGQTLDIVEVMSTEVGCEGNEAEGVFVRRLQSARSFEITGATLRLRDEGGTVVLELEAGDPDLLDRPPTR